MYSHNRDKDEFERKSNELTRLALDVKSRHLLYLSSDFILKFKE